MTEPTVSEVSTAAGTSSEQTGFVHSVREETRLLDLCLLASIPVALLAVYQLPVELRESLVFQVGSPTLLTAYTAHFVHLSDLHLLGNILIYVIIAPVAYLLCVLSARRSLFYVTLTTLVTVFPLALSAMQLAFPRQREILGFSGINAGFFGLLSLALVLYVGHQFARRSLVRYAPGALFITVGMIALVTLPERAWRVEIAAGAMLIGFGYFLLAASNYGVPGREQLGEFLDQPGYAELAGGATGLVVAYPFVGFQDAVVVGESVVDVYIHLLGFCLAFIVVFAYVVVVEEM